MAEESKAEIVANVLNVLVKEGDAIADGDTVVLLGSIRWRSRSSPSSVAP